MCVERCVGDDWWADSLTMTCTAVCSNSQFEDNSTIAHRCTQICPVGYYGDVPLMKCIDHCYGGRFGDNVAGSDRMCVTRCNGSYYGLLTGTRACVAVCPDGTWGEDTTFTCVLSRTDCPLNQYADNYTHKCVAKGACTHSLFSTDSLKLCVFKCPDGEYADEAQMHCLTSCSGTGQFSDPGINKCVDVCYTDGYFAEHLGHECVQDCATNTYR